jgi:hypothetical protein
MSTEINIKKRIDIQEEGVSITPDVNSINFTGDGVTASAIGDDVTVNIPGGTGTITYYLNESVTQAPYKEFTSILTASPEQTIITSVASGATVTVQSFQTPSGVPGTTNIPGGRWAFYLHFSGTTGDSWDVFAEVYKRDLGGIETLLLTTDAVPTSTLTGAAVMLLTDGVLPTSTVLTTDRIVVKVRVTNTDVTTNSITFHTEGNTNYSIATTTINQVVPTGAVTSVTGTSPIASSGGTTPAISISQSGTASDGYLSSTDWTTFNSKVPSTRNVTINGTTQDLSADRTWSVGTVTSAGITAGTGISLAGTNPITSSGTITVTNSAPDQTVVLTAGTGIGVTGTYPNFTVSNTDPTTGVTLASAGGTETLVNDGTGPSLATKGITAGTGISLSSTATDLTVTNAAPDQVVALTAGTGINVTGTYPNFTIANTVSDTNIYNADGTVTGDRQVDLAGNDLFFNDGFFASTFRFNSDDGSSSTLIDASPSGITLGKSGGGTGKAIIISTTDISLDGKFTVDNTKNTSGQNLEVVGQTKTTTFQLTTTPTAGHVLTSDASGNGTWQAASGGVNIYNTDGSLTADRTVTMNNFGLTFNGAGGANGSQINISSAANRSKALNFQVGSGLRWKQQVSGVEIGSDLGSQLAMLYYDDAGTLKGTAFSISRTDGAFRLNNAYSLPLSGGTTGQVLTSTTLGLTAFQSLPAEIQVAASDETTNLTTGTAKVTFRMPHAMTLTAVRASLTTAQIAGALLTVDINLNGVSVLGTKLTFDNSEKTTVTAATPATIVTSALTDDGEITVDIDTVGTALAKGLKITLIGTRA